MLALAWTILAKFALLTHENGSLVLILGEKRGTSNNLAHERRLCTLSSDSYSWPKEALITHFSALILHPSIHQAILHWHRRRRLPGRIGLGLRRLGSGFGGGRAGGGTSGRAGGACAKGIVEWVDLISNNCTCYRCLVGWFFLLLETLWWNRDNWLLSLRALVLIRGFLGILILIIICRTLSFSCCTQTTLLFFILIFVVLFFWFQKLLLTSRAYMIEKFKILWMD